VIRRILVPLDESPRAPAVLERALEIAVRFGASVRVFHAVSVRQDYPPGAHTGAADPLPAHLVKTAKERFSKLTAGVHEVALAVLVKESHQPADAILAEAAAFDADLVVIGSHGFKGLDRLLGTTTTKVLHGASRDVLVVHPP
jgi:universal stress protein F